MGITRRPKPRRARHKATVESGYAGAASTATTGRQQKKARTGRKDIIFHREGKA